MPREPVVRVGASPGWGGKADRDRLSVTEHHSVNAASRESPPGVLVQLVHTEAQTPRNMRARARDGSTFQDRR